MRPGSPGPRETPMRRPSAGDSEALVSLMRPPLARFARLTRLASHCPRRAARTRSTRGFCRHAVHVQNGFAAGRLQLQHIHTAPGLAALAWRWPGFRSVTKFITSQPPVRRRRLAQGDQLCSSPPEPPMNTAYGWATLQPLGALPCTSVWLLTPKARAFWPCNGEASFFDGPHGLAGFRRAASSPTERFAARANVPHAAVGTQLCGPATRRAPLVSDEASSPNPLGWRWW